jgi:hypothetical protein
LTFSLNMCISDGLILLLFVCHLPSTITCLSHVFCDTWVLYYTNIFISHHLYNHMCIPCLLWHMSFVLQNYIFITHYLYNHMCIPCLLWPHEFCITLTYLSLAIFTITCVSHVFCDTWVLYYTNIFITHHLYNHMCIPCLLWHMSFVLH